MSSEKLYYKKYLKYKQKYKILQIQIGGENYIPLFARNKSLNFTDQGDERTCFAHSIARLFARLIKLFLLNNFVYKEDCSYFYDTIKCKLTIFDCFSMEEKGNCDNYQEHISALLFHFIYVILIEEYGCSRGGSPIIATQYFIDYIKKKKITFELIIKKLNYDSNNHSNYFYLIEKLNDIINKAKSDLFNNKLIVYSTYISDKQIFKVHKYTNRLDYLENHALKELLNTIELKKTLIYILNNGYYATFTYGRHIVIITEYDAITDALVIKNSYGKQNSRSDIDKFNKWCPIIKNNRISFTDLLYREIIPNEHWRIFFVYSTIKLTPIIQSIEFQSHIYPIETEIIKSHLETIKTEIIEIRKYISTKTLEQKIDVKERQKIDDIYYKYIRDIKEYLVYINNILKAILSIKVSRFEILSVEKDLENLKKDIKQFNRSNDSYSLTPFALGSKLLSYFSP